MFGGGKACGRVVRDVCVVRDDVVFLLGNSGCYPGAFAALEERENVVRMCFEGRVRQCAVMGCMGVRGASPAEKGGLGQGGICNEKVRV